MAYRIALLLVLLGVPAALAAQDGTTVSLGLPRGDAVSTQGPTVSAAGVFASADLRRWLDGALPVHLHYRVELWPAHGFFRDVVATAAWDVVVFYDPLPKQYTVRRYIGGVETDDIGMLRSIEAVDSAVQRPFVPALHAPRDGKRYYYTAILVVERLNGSDLGGVLSWLRGDVQPAIHGEKNPGTVFARGATTLLTHLLGGGTNSYSQRSPTFTAPEAPSP